MKKFINLLIAIFLSSLSIDAQTVIDSKYKAFTFEEIAAPLMMMQQAYNQTMNAIDELSEYIIDILGHDIDTQMRNEMNVEYQAIQTVAQTLESTGNIKNARSEYNRVKNSVRQKVVNYNNRVAQARQRAAEDIAKPQQAEQPSNWSGSGFALNNGYICTNYHVVEDAKSIEILGVQGDFSISYSAKVIAIDKFNDLALLQIDDSKFKGFGAIPYKVNTSMAEVGENIFVLGYPMTTTMGDEIKLTNGIISSRTGFQGNVSLYQISAPIQPGNSGGPLFDNHGNLIGIVSSKHKGAENVGYAIKASYLRNLMESSIATNVLPVNNSVSSLPLTGQVKQLKKFVYLIKCSTTPVIPHSKVNSTTTNNTTSSSPNTTKSIYINIKVGESKILSITSEQSVWWESDNPNCATITEGGVVRGVSSGVAHIWAHIGDEVILHRVFVSNPTKPSTSDSTNSNTKPQYGTNSSYSSEIYSTGNRNTTYSRKNQEFDFFVDLGFSYAMMQPSSGGSFPVSIAMGATFNNNHFWGGGINSNIAIGNDNSIAFPIALFANYVKSFRTSFLDCRVGPAVYLHTTDSDSMYKSFSAYMRFSYSFLMTSYGAFGISIDTFIPGGYSIGIVWTVGGNWKCYI